MAYDDYVMQQRGRHDRGLLFHTGGGADVVRPVQSWRPADHENDGKGTLINYDLGKIRAQRWREGRPSRDALFSQQQFLQQQQQQLGDGEPATAAAATTKKLSFTAAAHQQLSPPPLTSSFSFSSKKKMDVAQVSPRSPASLEAQQLSSDSDDMKSSSSCGKSSSDASSDSSDDDTDTKSPYHRPGPHRLKRQPAAV